MTDKERNARKVAAKALEAVKCPMAATAVRGGLSDYDAEHGEGRAPLLSSRVGSAPRALAEGAGGGGDIRRRAEREGAEVSRCHECEGPGDPSISSNHRVGCSYGDLIDARAEERALLLRALKALHAIGRSPSTNCAIDHGGGCDCGGDAVRAVLSHPLAVALLKEANCA